MTNELGQLRELIIKAEYPKYTDFCKTIEDGSASYAECDKWSIIENGAITVSEVLIALENSFEGEDGCFGLNFHHGLFDSWWITLSKSGAGIIETWICKWDLTKDLDQQSPETLSQLLKLLNND